MGSRERQRVRNAIETAQGITADSSDDQMYTAAQDEIRRAEEAAGPLDSWIARQSTY